MSYNVYSVFNSQELVTKYHKLLLPEFFKENEHLLIVQNQNLANWLGSNLSHNNHILLNYNPQLPEHSQRQLLNDFPSYIERKKLADGKQKTLLFQDTLQVILYKKLEILFQQKAEYPQLQALWHYLQKTNARTDDDLNLSLKALSNELSRLFHYYGLNCLKLLQIWEKDEPLDLELENQDWLLEHEKWQRALWQELMHEEHYLLLGQVLQSLQEEQADYGGQIKKIVLVGSTFLGEVSLDFFYYLSQFCEIHHLILTPQTLQKSPLNAEENNALNESPSLFEQWGALFQGFHSKLNSYADIIYHDTENEIAVTNNENLSNLAQLQLNLQNHPFKLSYNSNDESLICHCSSVAVREVEIAKNSILQWLKIHPETPLHKIALVSPTMENYIHLFEFIFPQNNAQEMALPLYILKDKEKEGYFQQAFYDLLALVDSRFERSHLFKLWDNPCWQKKHNISPDEVKLFSTITEQFKIHWGYDLLHLKSLGFDIDKKMMPYSWHEGIRRILNQLDSENTPLLNIQSDQIWYLIGVFIKQLEDLYRDFYSLQTQKMELEEWIARLEFLLEKYLEPNNDAEILDRLVVKSGFKNLVALLNDLNNLQEFEDKKFSFNFFKDLLLTQIRNGALHPYEEKGILVGSLEALRGISFDFIYMMGLDESYPHIEQTVDFDLRELLPSVIPLNQENNQKQAFLEICLSAQKKIVFSYKGIDPLQGEQKYPSIFLEQLVDAFDMSLEDWQIIHPLHSFSQSYFNEENTTLGINYDEVAFRNAQTLSQKYSASNAKKSSLFWPVEKPAQIPIKNLIKLWQDPLFEIKNQLQLYSRKDEILAQEDVESMQLNGLEMYQEKQKFWQNYTEKLPYYETMEKWLEHFQEQDIFKLAPILIQKNINELKETLDAPATMKHPIPDLERIQLLVQKNPPLHLNQSKPRQYYIPSVTIRLNKEDEGTEINACIDGFYALNDNNSELYCIDFVSEKQLYAYKNKLCLYALYFAVLRQESKSSFHHLTAFLISKDKGSEKTNDRINKLSIDLRDIKNSYEQWQNILTLLYKEPISPHYISIFEKIVQTKNEAKERNEFIELFTKEWDSLENEEAKREFKDDFTDEIYDSLYRFYLYLHDFSLFMKEENA